jgi:hypothetical protein
MPDVFGVNIQFFELGNVIRIGSDDYYIFPTYLKHGDDVAGSGAGTSYWSGIAHRLYRGD